MIRWMWNDRVWAVATMAVLLLAFVARDAAADVAACMILAWVAVASGRRVATAAE